MQGKFKKAEELYKQVLQQAHDRYNWVSTYEWVDDITQRAEGPRQTVKARLVQAGAFLVTGFEELGLAVSPKSQVMASDASLAVEIVLIFKHMGTGIKRAEAVTYMGIDQGAAGKRYVPTHNRRKLKAARRFIRIKKLARGNNRSAIARKLAISGGPAIVLLRLQGCRGFAP